MRHVALIAILLIAGVAGCLDRAPKDGNVATPRLSSSDIETPTGATLVAIDGGFAALWNDTPLPLVVHAVVPQHATMIRAVADSGATSVSMSNAETGRRRCNNPTVEDFSRAFQYPKSCSSVTALDVPGATWRITFQGNTPQNSADVNVQGTRGSVRIEYLDRPLDGLLAHVNVAAIDPPILDLQDTQVQFVPSFDGVRLRTETTLPQGPGPWPAIIVSSPYYTHAAGAPPADWNYVVQDWAKRGYAMVTADVRGFGDSGGCVEVWGINEQKDQKFLVEWVAKQSWSNGKVGFYGQSYVGTTPVAAAVQAPEALKAIVTIAPVINAYEDWHHGGVPNGENKLSPVAYQVLTESTISETQAELAEGAFLNDPQQLANNAANGLCDPTLVARANDPRANYNAFYEERNFKLRADKVQAAVLYSQGFEDANVKSTMIPGWFNEIQSPKLGLFGHWLHQHATRLDCEALFIGWFEQHLKGKNLGLDKLPTAVIQVNRTTERYGDSWPPTNPLNTTLWAKFGDGAPTGALVSEPTPGRQVLFLDSTGRGTPNQPNVQATLPSTITLRATLNETTSLAGVGIVRVTTIPQGAFNAYLGAELWHESANGSRLVTWGQFNMAHRNGHTNYDLATPAERISFNLPLRPTEYLFEAGSTLRLQLRGVMATQALDAGGLLGQRMFLDGGTDGTRLILPGMPLSDYTPIALTGRP
jgi:predicted acyl esterase